MIVGGYPLHGRYLVLTKLIKRPLEARGPTAYKLGTPPPKS